jgi:hypothetical protein
LHDLGVESSSSSPSITPSPPSRGKSMAYPKHPMGFSRMQWYLRRIVAEQAVIDLSSIVKELVDNALDVESSTIKGKLK